MGFNRRAALLVSTMIAALMLVLGGAISRFTPGWRPELLAGACFLVALETGFVHHAARHTRMAFGELLRYLVPELFVMAVLMRLAATLSFGGRDMNTSITRWLYDPLSIFEPVFVLYILAGLLAGVLAHLGMHDMTELAPRPSDGPDELRDSGRRFASIMAEERAVSIRGMNQRFVLGAGLLLIALGLEAVNLGDPRGPAMPIGVGSVAGVIVYVVAGFLLVSQARLALLESRWRQEGASVAPAVAPRWNRASWLLVLIVVGGTALLPRTYGRGLLETLAAGLALVGYIVGVLGYLVVWLFGMLLAIPAWLLSLLLPEMGGRAAPPAPPAIPPPPAVVEQEPRLLPALVFWLCAALLLGYAVRAVLQRHPGLLQGMLRWSPLSRLLGWLGGLWEGGSRWAGMAAQRAGQALRRLEPAPAQRGRRLPRLGALGPRELIRYFYRSTLQRAAERGVLRRGGQTPYEYRTTLADQVPEAADDIAELTEAFVVAQYAPRPVDDLAAGRARGPWERLRSALRGRRKERAS